MLVIRPRTEGAGIFDIFSRVANSALAKKVINSTVGKKVIEQVTKENLRKAVDSAIGKKLQTAVVKGVADATERAANATFQKIGISSPVQPGAIAKVTEKATTSGLQKLKLSALSQPALEKEVLEQVLAASTIPTPPKGRKRKIASTPGRSKKKKRTGFGIILE